MFCSLHCSCLILGNDGVWFKPTDGLLYPFPKLCSNCLLDSGFFSFICVRHPVLFLIFWNSWHLHLPSGMSSELNCSWSAKVCLVINYCHLSVSLNVLFSSPTLPHLPPSWWEQPSGSSSCLVFSLRKLEVQEELNPGPWTPQISHKALETHKLLLSQSHCLMD